jgi:hypothetical protein
MGEKKRGDGCLYVLAVSVPCGAKLNNNKKQKTTQRNKTKKKRK